MAAARNTRIFFRCGGFLAVTGLALLALFFVVTPKAYAAGAVGSGGSGGGGGGANDPNTRNGHGWYAFDVNGAGPNTLRGATWPQIAATCRGVSASTVIAYVINRPDGNPYTGAIYDFQSVNATYRAFRNGGGGYLTLADATAAFNSLDPADRAGYTFGVNVGWFCYNFAPPPPPPTIVNCGGWLVTAPEPVQNYTTIQVVGDVSYSGGPAGAPVVSNNGIWINPQFPGGIASSATWNGATIVTVTSAPFVPNASGVYTFTWGVQVNETYRSCSASFVVYPPTVANCGTASSIPSQSEVNTPITVNATGGWSGGPPSIWYSNLGISVTPTPGNVPLAFWSVAGGNVSMTTSSYTPTSAGVYTITWTFKINEAPVQTCTTTMAVLNHPYFEVNGGDVLAGTAFSTAAGTPCAASAAPHNTSAGLAGWNSRTSPSYGGAGIDYAAYALNYIQDVSTSRANINPNAQALSFSNVSAGAPASVTPASGLFGGLFGSLATCVDYWGSKPPDSALTTWSGGNVSGAQTGQYVYNGNLTLTGGNVANGRRVTLYVNGDVYLTGNINYPSSGGWSRTEQIPTFTLVVYGRIFINENVNELDGIYVAVPDAAADYANPAKARDSVANPRKGTILTCSPGGFIGYSLIDIANNPALCDGNGSPLTVYGSFIGAQIFLLRARESVTTGQPAEVFNYTPEVWLAPSDNNAVGTEYDSVVGLPPVL